MNELIERTCKHSIRGYPCGKPAFDCIELNGETVWLCIEHYVEHSPRRTPEDELGDEHFETCPIAQSTQTDTRSHARSGRG
jgi:hypothetical protein